jgi:hypothetical protein
MTLENSASLFYVGESMNGPPLEVRAARPDQKEVLRNLLQLYMYD